MRQVWQETRICMLYVGKCMRVIAAYECLNAHSYLWWWRCPVDAFDIEVSRYEGLLEVREHLWPCPRVGLHFPLGLMDLHQYKAGQNPSWPGRYERLSVVPCHQNLPLSWPDLGLSIPAVLLPVSHPSCPIPPRVTMVRLSNCWYANLAVCCFWQWPDHVI